MNVYAQLLRRLRLDAFWVRMAAYASVLAVIFVAIERPATALITVLVVAACLVQARRWA